MENINFFIDLLTYSAKELSFVTSLGLGAAALLMVV